MLSINDLLPQNLTKTSLQSAQHYLEFCMYLSDGSDFRIVHNETKNNVACHGRVTLRYYYKWSARGQVPSSAKTKQFCLGFGW